MFTLYDEIRNGNLVKVRDIVDENPNLVNKYLYGVTPFLYSLECEQQDIALELAKNSNIDFSLKDNQECCCLEKAIDSKMYKVVEIICRMSNKSDLNKVLITNNETFLTNSIKMNDYQVAIALIRGGVDLNTPNKMNEYPLQLAIKFNQIDVVEAMLATQKIYLQTLESIAYNPLIDSCEKDSTEIAKMLIEKGADLNVYDKDQLWTPLMYAITNSNETIIEKLINHKCNVNTVDIDGNSPLHLAALTSDEYIARIILKMQPDRKIKNKNNQTPLEIAVENEDEILISLLS